MGPEQSTFAAQPDFSPIQDRVTSALYEVIRTMGNASIELSPSPTALNEIKPPTGRFINKVLGTKLCLPLEEGFIKAEEWSRGKEKTPAEIYDSIARTAIGKHYPEMAVPKEFQEARPNVRFLPPALRYYRNTGRLADMSALRYILAHGLDTTPITDAAQAAEIIFDLQHNFPHTASREDKSRILGDIYQNLVSNLELHRLAADAEGVVVRFSDTPEEDLNPIGQPIPRDKLPFLGLLHPEINEQYRGRWMTWWHRHDIKPDDNASHNLFGRQRIASTLADLEKCHLVTLDLACEAAIVAIRNDTDATMAA